MKYLKIIRVSLQNALQYRSNVLMGFAFYTLFIYVFFCLWRAIYAGGQVEGYTFTQLIWYLCLTELISYGTRTSVYRQITDDVKTGAIAYHLGRPYRYVPYQFANALGGIVLNTTMYGALALLLGMLFVGPIAGFDLRTLPLGLVSLFLGMAINFFFHMALGLTAFRLEETSGIFLIYSKLVFMMGTFIPVEFLPGWLQGLAKALPFSYVSWAPARLIVAFDWHFFLRVVPVQILYLGVAILLCEWMHESGVKNIQANGG